VGCRFTDWVASSYRHGASFAIPPTKLIQIDIDPHEIGKNYPTTIGILADAKVGLADLLTQLQDLSRPKDYKGTAYFKEIQRLNAEWDKVLAKMQRSIARPTTISRALKEIRAVTPRDTIVVTGAGLVQCQVWQEFEVYMPRTHITSGGFSTMGFTVPGAIGARLAAPDAPVLGIAGDGDFLQTMQEMAVAVQKALASGRPSLVEIMTAREWPHTAVSKSGWWDVPVPTYLPNKRKEYEKGRAEEKL
jgi:acetolactate synthase-1/2/3 large subunit